jgi:hypothetical protein
MNPLLAPSIYMRPPYTTLGENLRGTLSWHNAQEKLRPGCVCGYGVFAGNHTLWQMTVAPNICQ